jgi:flagellar motor switch/type III secretory pathway protein FliN
VSEHLRIRSEAPSLAELAEPWFPAVAGSDGAPDDDLAFADLAAAAAAALTGLFGLAFIAQPGRPLPAHAPAVAPELAAMLASVRLGGDPLRETGVTGGVVMARHGAEIAAVLAPVVEAHWPAGSRRGDFWLECLHMDDGRAFGGPVRLLAPERPAAAAGPDPAHVRRLLALPLPVRVELAGMALPLHQLLPLHVGKLLPLPAHAELPLLLGDHAIGRATLAPLPDGRQQASLIAIAPEPRGDRA